MQGLGAGFIGTATYSIIMSEFIDQIPQTIGLLQMSNAVGFMIGPVGASGLYSLGGFSTIFITYGIIFAIILPILYCMIKSDSSVVPKINTLSQLDLLKHKELVMILSIQFAANSCVCYVSPTYSLHLQSFGISDNYFGLIFSTPTIAYLIGIVFVLKSTTSKRSLMLVGLLTLAICHALVGPWKYTFLPHEFAISLIAFASLGIGLCICTLTSIPVLLERAHSFFPEDMKDEVSDIVSSMTNAIYFTCETYAPPLSGFLKDSFGFENSQAIFAGALVSLWLIIIITIPTTTTGKVTKPVINYKDVELLDIKERLTDDQTN